MQPRNNSVSFSSILQPFAKLIKTGTVKQLTDELMRINDDDILSLPLNSNNDTALHLAARYNPELVPIILQRGANPCLENNELENALQILLDETPANFSLIKMMMQHGVSSNTKNSNGENVFDLTVRLIFRGFLKNSCNVIPIGMEMETIANSANNRKNANIDNAILFFNGLGDENTIRQYLSQKYNDLLTIHTNLINKINAISLYLDKKIKSHPPTIGDTDCFTVNGIASPAISIREYLIRLALQIDNVGMYDPVTDIYFTAALSCLESFVKKNKCELSYFNIHKLLLTSFVIAYKYLKDSNQAENSFIAKIGGVSAHQLTIMEREFLKKIDYIIPINAAALQRSIECVENARDTAEKNQKGFSIPFFSGSNTSPLKRDDVAVEMVCSGTASLKI